MRLDPLGAESLPQRGDVALKRRLGGLRRPFAPQRVEEIVSGDDLACMKEQEREKHAVLLSRGCEVDPIDIHLECAE